MSEKCTCMNCILPPHMLRHLLNSDDAAIREIALNTLLVTSRLRGERSVRAAFAGLAAPGHGRRTVYDCGHRITLSTAKLIRSEDGKKSVDDSVNRVFDGFGATRDFYQKIFKRDSIDGKGMRLDGYVHRGLKYNNAFWDGREMVFGDGDGLLFTDFTKSLDVIAHELTHGVTEHTAGLEYHNQSGALNEAISDIFGSLVKQWKLQQTAKNADWLIGAEIFTPAIKGDALRSLKAPGTAYNDPKLGKDPQPAHMRDYVDLPDTDDGDYGGVHINSGIPNRAFYETAVRIGGYAWLAPGRIWYEALKASTATTDFQAFADTTFTVAGNLYGNGSAEQLAVRAGWHEVGIEHGGLPLASVEDSAVALAGFEAGADSTPDYATVLRKLEALTKQVAQISADREAVHT